MSEREKTRLVHVSRARPVGLVGTVNPPVVRCSTGLYRDIATRKEVRARREQGERLFMYGASGTPTAFALEDAINEIEGGERSVLLPTGLAAIAHVFLSLLRPGDHVLLGETVYGPARAIALNYLGPRGIACEFYPGGYEEVAKRLRPSTRLVYLDNPGSIVYDIQDVPALARLLKGRDTLLAVDNTWGCPAFIARWRSGRIFRWWRSPSISPVIPISSWGRWRRAPAARTSSGAMPPCWARR